MRTIESIKLLKKHFTDIIISIDTFRSKIAHEAIDNGAAIINDISAGEDDALMLDTVAELNVPYIMMHKRGTPQTINQSTQYEDVTRDVFDYFTLKITESQKITYP